MKFEINRPRSDQLTEDVIVDELKRVAKFYGNRRFTRHEFDTVAKTCKGSSVLKYFSTWDAALKATDLTLTPYRKARRDQIPVEDLLSELARVWEALGHRPSKTEWDNSDSKYSYTTYKTRFGGWLNACRTLLGNSIADELKDEAKSELSPRSMEVIPPERSRTVPLKMRLAVLKRDRYRCVLCGRSPATHPNVALHLDHIVPYSRGGKTVKANLQTLCEDCNWGKGTDAHGK